MLWLLALLSSVITGVILVCAVIGYRKVAAGGGAAAKKEKLGQIEAIMQQAQSLSAFEKGYGSYLQFESIQGQLADLKDAFQKQSAQLKEIEESLDKTQKSVEEKEARQQEYKTLKEEDENKLTELLTTFETLSEESIALEQELALSLKNVEDMLASTELSVQEKEILTEFNEALLSAGGRLLDLMTEYQVVKERLEGLQGQFKDLEEEYTRLVEQQLGVA